MESLQVPTNSEGFKAVNEIFRNIDSRNQKIISEIEADKKNFDEKTQKIIKFIQFRNKVDKLECAYNLMISPKEAQKIKKITEKTEDKLFAKALKKAKGDEKKAIAMLFNASSDISI